MRNNGVIGQQFLGFLLALAMGWGCASVPKENQSGDLSWPASDPSMTIRESEYLDMGLRVLALELSRESQGKTRYNALFLPQLGKIEFQCVFDEDHADWPLRLNAEMERIQAGTQDLLANLSLAKEFDTHKHLEVHFQSRAKDLSEFAVFRQGKLNWLVLPEKLSGESARKGH